MGRELAWTHPTAGRLVLTDRDSGYRVTKGASGLGDVSWSLITDVIPGVDGDRVLDQYADPRTVQLPMIVSGPDRDTFLTRMRALVAVLDARVESTLELAQADGRTFRLACRYTGGLPDVEDRDSGGDTTWVRFMLKAYASDPFWKGEALDPRFDYAPPTAFFPILPLTLSPSSVLGAVTLQASGDVPAWPTWKITGPGSYVDLRNTDTGEYLKLSGTIPSGRTLTVVTTPGRQSISLSDGTDWWPMLVPGSTFFRIPPTAHLSLVVTGAAAGTSVTACYSPRCRTPW